MRPDWMFVRKAEPSSAPVRTVAESACTWSTVRPAHQQRASQVQNEQTDVEAVGPTRVLPKNLCLGKGAPVAWKWPPCTVRAHVPVLGSQTRRLASLSPPPVTTSFPSGVNRPHLTVPLCPVNTCTPTSQNQPLESCPRSTSDRSTGGESEGPPACRLLSGHSTARQ